MVAKTREEKIKAISAKVDATKLSDEQVDLLYDQIEVLYKHFDKNKPKVKNNKKPKVIKKKKVNKGSDKYKLTLEFVNKILSSLEKPKITDLTAFKEIDRLDIIKEEHTTIYNEYMDRIFTTFIEMKKSMYERLNQKNLILNVLRGMCRGIGVSLVLTKKDITTDGFRRTHYLYSIV